MEIDRKVFHNLAPGVLSGKTFQVVIVQEAHRDSIEFKQHASTLASYLTGKGMRRSEGATDFVVTLDFTIRGESKTGVASVPHFRTTGGTSSFNATTYGGGKTYNTTGTVSSYPTLQYAGSSSHSYSYNEYTRELSIGIFEGKDWLKGKKSPVFEAQAYSTGTTRDTTLLVPRLIDSLLFDFPAPSGTSDNQIRAL
jgi:hypothetical protein